MTDIIIIVVLVLILGAALTYMRKEKKRGVKCIGCPDAEACAKRRNGESCQDTSSKNTKTNRNIK